VKIKMIAAAALVPAAAAGVALSAGTTAKASPPQHSASASALHSAGVRAHVVAAKTHSAARGKADAVHTAAKHTSKHAARPQAAAARAGQVQASQQAQSAAPSQQSLNAGESSFEQCVAWRESSDTPTDPDGLFGILPSTWASLGYSGTAGQASVAQQKVAFNRLYAEYGAQPWAPSDGC
jgi:hypothetical protein